MRMYLLRALPVPTDFNGPETGSRGQYLGSWEENIERPRMTAVR